VAVDDAVMKQRSQVHDTRHAEAGSTVGLPPEVESATISTFEGSQLKLPGTEKPCDAWGE
jgi:hypothetical protein